MKKFIVAYIGDKCANTLAMSLDSIKDVADHIVFVWGTECKETNKILIEYEKELGDKLHIINRRYEHEHIGANGRARNAYLNILKEKYNGHYCLVLDPDEVCDERINNIQETIKKLEKDVGVNYALNPNMEHFISDLGHVDATQEKHYCPGRFFKITQDIIYPEVEHPVIQVYNDDMLKAYKNEPTDAFTIWHMAYCSEMFSILKRYKLHSQKSNIHSPQFLRNWYLQHLFGQYPKRDAISSKLPPIVKKHFDIESIAEETYFAGRKQVEVKHFLMTKQWQEHFKPLRVLDCGCGMGHYLYAFKQFGVDVNGFEFSQYAVNNRPYKDINIVQGDIKSFKTDKFYDLVTVLDVLEHVRYEDINNVLENIKEFGDTFLFSIPFLGNPDLDNDETHIIKESKEWWIDKLKAHGFIPKDVPEHFHFKHQLLIGETE